MPSLIAAMKAVAAHRRAGTGAKAIVQSGPLLVRGGAGRSLVSDWPTERAIEKFFKSSALVYRPVMALATAVGSVRWQVEELHGEDAWETVPGHPLQALLDKPHEYFSRQDWNETLVLYLVLTGNALFEKTVASGKLLPGATKPRILEMTPLVPDGFGVVPGGPEGAWITRYEHKASRRTWQPDELLHFMLRDPGNLFWGMSPLQAAASLVLMDLKAVRWNLESMDNRAVVDGVYTSEAPLTTAQYEEVSDQIYDQHTGPDRAHAPMVISGATWQDNARNPVEMDFNETRKNTREEILSDLYTPPVIAGYFDNATLANAEVSRRLFWEDNLIPAFVERIVGGLNHHVVPHFGAVGKLRITYDISGIPALREDLAKKFDMLRVGTASGVPFNQMILELGLDIAPVETWGDLPFGLEQFRVAQAGAATTAPGDPAALPADPFAAQPAAPTAAPVVGAQDVQVSTASVLGGAQITAATAIVTAVAAGEIPLDAGLGQLQVLFNLTPEQAAQIMGSAGTTTPTVANPKPAPESAPAGAAPTPGVVPPQLVDTMIPAKGILSRGRKLSVGISSGVFATDVADAEAPTIRRALLALLTKMRQGIKLEDLVAAVRASDLGAALQRMGSHALLPNLAETLGPELTRTAARGASLAGEKLAADLGLSLPLDSSRLKTWAATYTEQRVAQLTATTEEAVRGFFVDLAAGKLGDSVEAAAQLLQESWGLHQQQASGVRNVFRALLDVGKTPAEALAKAGELARGRLLDRVATIAEHESLVAANRGNGMAWEMALADGHAASVTATWFAEDDAATDDICIALDGQEIELGSGDRFTGPNGLTYREPPEPHPGCVVGESLIGLNDPGAIAVRRQYQGEVVTLQTAGGRHLTITPKHPVLTRRGWVPAGLLVPGDEIFGETTGERSPVRGVDESHVPASAKEVFNAAAKASNLGAIEMPVSAEDFHGDGAQSDVAVAIRYGALPTRPAAGIEEQVEEQRLVGAATLGALLDGEDLTHSFRFAPLATASGGVGSGDLSLPRRNVHLAPPQQLSFGLPSRLDAAVAQALVDSAAVDPEVVSQALYGGPAKIETGDLVAIERHWFSGFVYNFETVSGCYFAGGILTHNCRCGLIYGAIT